MDEPRHWVRIQRRILGGSLWADLHGSRIFLYLILAAEWREGPERGTVWTTRAAIAEANHCTVGELEAALRRLRRRKRIETTRERSGMRIKVANYDRYQQWKRDPAQASKPRAKAPRAAAPAHQQAAPRVVAAPATQPSLVIPAEVIREAWHTGRKDWAGLAALPVKSLPIAAGETRHPLEWLTLDTWLAAPERRFVEWFRRQLSHSTPVFRPSQSDLLYCLAAMWDSMGRADSIRIARFAELAAHQTVDNWRAIGRHVNSLVPHLAAILKKSEAAQ
jgi:hypothetical protein